MIESRPKINWGEAYVPIGLVIYCLLYIIQVWKISIKSTGYPYFLMGLITLFLVIIYWKFVRGKTTEGGVPPGSSLSISGKTFWEFVKTSYRPVTLVIGTLCYSWISPILGFTFTTMLFMGVTLRIFGVRRTSLLLLLSVGYSFFLFSLMTFYLRITLPSFSFADLPFGL